MITVDPDIVGRLSSKAKDLNTGKGELEEYLKSHPVNPSNLLEPTFGTSDEDSERFKGRLTPRALDHPLNGIIERIPFFRRITAFPHNEIGFGWTASEAENRIKKETIMRMLERSTAIPNWDGTDSSVENVHRLVPATLLEPRSPCDNCFINDFPCVYTAPGKLSTWHVPDDPAGLFDDDLLANPDFRVVAAVELTSCLCCRYPSDLPLQSTNLEESTSDRKRLVDGDVSGGSATITCSHHLYSQGSRTYIFAGPQQYVISRERKERANRQNGASSLMLSSTKNFAGNSTNGLYAQNNALISVAGHHTLGVSSRSARSVKRNSNALDAEVSGQDPGPSTKRIRDISPSRHGSGGDTVSQAVSDPQQLPTPRTAPLINMGRSLPCLAEQPTANGSSGPDNKTLTDQNKVLRELLGFGPEVADAVIHQKLDIVRKHKRAGFDIELDLASPHPSLFDMPSASNALLVESAFIFWEKPNRIRILGSGLNVPITDFLRAAYPPESLPGLAVSRAALDVSEGKRVCAVSQVPVVRSQTVAYESLFSPTGRSVETSSTDTDGWDEGYEEMAYINLLCSTDLALAGPGWTKNQLDLLDNPLLYQVGHASCDLVNYEPKWSDEDFDNDRQYIQLAPHASTRDLSAMTGMGPVSSRISTPFLQQIASEIRVRNPKDHLSVIPHVLSDPLSQADMYTLSTILNPSHTTSAISPSAAGKQHLAQTHIMGIVLTGEIFTAFVLYLDHAHGRSYAICDHPTELRVMAIMQQVIRLMFGPAAASWQCAQQNELDIICKRAPTSAQSALFALSILSRWNEPGFMGHPRNIGKALTREDDDTKSTDQRMADAERQIVQTDVGLGKSKWLTAMRLQEHLRSVETA